MSTLCAFERPSGTQLLFTNNYPNTASHSSTHLQEVGLAGVCPLDILVKVVQQVLALCSTIKCAVELTPHVEHCAEQLQVRVPVTTATTMATRNMRQVSRGSVSRGLIACQPPQGAKSKPTATLKQNSRRYCCCQDTSRMPLLSLHEVCCAFWLC